MSVFRIAAAIFLIVIAWILWQVGAVAIKVLSDRVAASSVQQPIIVAPAPDSSDKVATLVKASVAESEARIVRELKDVIAQTKLMPPAQTVSSVVPAQPVEVMLVQNPTPIAPPSEMVPVVPEPDIRPSPVRLVIVEGESQKFYLPHDVHSRQWCYKLVEQGKISLSRKAGVKAIVGMPRNKGVISAIGSVFIGNEKIVTVDIPIDHERIVLPKGAKWVEFYWTREGSNGNTDPLTIEVRE